MNCGQTPDTYNSSSMTLANGSGMNSLWWGNVIQATTNWNGAPTKALISTSSSGNNVYAGSYADSWYGQYTPLTHSSTRTTSFKIELNSRTINRDATNFSNFETSTVTHEIGHPLGINDNSSSNCIMGYARDRNVLTTPQSDDISGVNVVWP